MCKEFMQEYHHYYQDRYITFNILEVDRDKGTITVNISDTGRLTVDTFELHNENGWEYFEYGVPVVERIYLDDFEEVA